jgi:hypothetical protein
MSRKAGNVPGLCEGELGLAVGSGDSWLVRSTNVLGWGVCTPLEEEPGPGVLQYCWQEYLVARIFGGQAAGQNFRVGGSQSVPEIFLPSNILAIPPEITAKTATTALGRKFPG